MMNYLKIFSRIVAVATAQAQAIPNAAGGHAFAVDDWARLDRFLILGSESGSYYATERELTRDNAAAVLHAIQADGPGAVARVVAISAAGRAPKNDPALFALALAASAAMALMTAATEANTHIVGFAGMLDVVGFDKATPAVIADFIRQD